ncbi:replicative DNA helicase [Pseudovibrio ascidiaceicola]|uniref:replicative DNA helicase n=1 Tax=Pseudovibrio ascidiaceicola TaxID=285279 RepID=UPI003D36621D
MSQNTQTWTEIEHSALGLILNNHHLYFVVRDRLTPEHFEVPSHRAIYTGIEKAVSPTGLDLNMVDLYAGEAPEDQNRYLLIASIAASAIDITAGIEDLCRPLFERYDRAQSLKLIDGLKKELEANQDLQSTLKKAKSDFELLSVRQSPARAERLHDVTESIVSGLLDGSQENFLMSTGFAEIDRVLGGGLAKTELITLGGIGGCGKTALATQILHNIAENYGPTDFYSLEMDKKAFASRRLATLSGVSLYSIRAGRVNEDNGDLEKVVATSLSLKGLPFYVDAEPGATIEHIYRTALKNKMERGLEAIVVDSIKATEVDDRRMNAEDVRKAQFVVKELKKIAKELEIAVIALAHEVRKTAAPRSPTQRITRQELYGGGTLEQTSDVIFILHRPEAGLLATKPDANAPQIEVDEWYVTFNEWEGRAQLIPDKMRNAAIVKPAELHFDGASVAFMQDRAFKQAELI